MAQPNHFDNGSRHVLKLVQALYGIIQAGHIWHQKLCQVLESLGFTRNTADECVYIKRTHESTLIITIYVNDLGLFTSKSKMVKLKQDLKDDFAMMDLSEMKKILGIQVIWD